MRMNFLPRMPENLSGLRLPDTQSRTRKPARPRPRRNGGAGAADRLALTEVRGHLTFTATTVTAWYTLAEKVWPFRSDAGREGLLTAIAGQYAALGGMRLHLRRTSVPFDIKQWVSTLKANSNPLPDDPAANYPSAPMGSSVYIPPTWGQHLDNVKIRLADGEYSQGRTQLGVTFARPSRLLRVGKSSAAGLDEATVTRVDELTEALGAAGMSARPSTPDELAWLIYRSVGVGLAPPAFLAGDVGPDDIAEFADNVDWLRGPYSSTTQLTDRRTGNSVHVAVLTVGRMEPQEIPQVNLPWAHLSEQADWPVEWSSRVDIVGPAATARGKLEQKLRMIRWQQRDYADHNLPEPLELERLAQRATEVGDQIDTGMPEEASRAHGWHRMAVHAPTHKECLARVRELTRMYHEKARVQLVHPKCQVPLLREFIPGEPVADTGYVRRMPVKMLAAAVPQATASVGDNRGDLIGYTATGGERPVFFDPHFPMEVRERSGLAVLVSEPGGGKSTLMGALGYLAARRGVRVTLMDPSGPLARLCQMPELRRYSRVVDLVGSQRGTLAPYALIPTPRRADFEPGPAGDHKFDSAVAFAQAERSALAQDITQMLLPHWVLDDATVMMAVREALRHVPAEETSTLDDVTAVLDKLGDAGNVAAKNAAGLLFDAARMPLAQLFFGSPPPGTLDTDAALTVITMGGLRLPDLSIERKHWSVEETLAVPMLHTANRLAVRRCYSGPQQARKFVGLDEAHFMQGWPSGRAFLVRLSRDSRKWNIAGTVASQNPADILSLDVQNLVSTVFVGRIVEDAEIAAEALRLLRVQHGIGYEATLAALSQHADTASHERLGYREFVMRDVDGRVQKLRVDVSYVNGLLDYLDTTPGGTK